MVQQTHHTVIRKVIIPVAGLGTRFLPATKAQPKEMLPVVDKPVIQYLVEEAVASGAKDIIFVTGRGKRAIEDHFDSSPELEEALQKKGKDELLKAVQDISGLANFTYVRQKEAKGDGDAILCAAHLIGDEPVAVLFGDDIVMSETPCLKQLMNVYEKYNGPVIALEKIPKKDLSRFGVIGGKPLGENVYEIEKFVEKPDPEDAPSDLAVVGKYIVTPDVLEELKNIQKSEGESLDAARDKELRLADAFTALCGKRSIYGLEFTGERYDCGSKLGFLKATIEFGLKHKELNGSFREYLKERTKEID
ncbi:UTP--glucose-1-phosphate uridylyltransferase [bacterium]|nr:UTP--glucose-1-phosphate uridylyltransferase [bacterium]|tara:strand:- start:3053 stop:3970 length:918 start_codon:yes stop_codon:yes gene_type:complete